MKILILGGYGVFGGRLAALLSDMPQLHILIAGRSQQKAEQFCANVSGLATFEPAKIDRVDIAQALSIHRPDLVVDASGPFQDYGNNPYFVVKACIAAKVHYFDFADAADFVFGISAYDIAAKAADVTVLSGVSSFPVLTAAVLRELGKDMSLLKVSGGIAPSPYAGIGLNVMRAVVSYAGGPVKLIRAGQAFTAKGLTESLRYTIAPPGYLPLRNLRFSLVDVPDLQVLPRSIPSITDIWMGAGPVPEFLHRILNLLAKVRAHFGLPSFAVLSPLFYKILNLMKFDEHRGGMFVEASGIKDGQPCVKSWHLLAEGDDGPYIPSMAIEALLRKWDAGESPAYGARPATQALELHDYETLFATRTIYTGIRENTEPNTSSFRAVLGHAFKPLPAKIKALHSPLENCVWQGEAEVERGANPLARIIAACVGITIKSGKTPLIITIKPENGREVWTRDFGGRRFSSLLEPGKGRNKHLITERFGPIKIAMALTLEGSRLVFTPRRWSFFGCPMPNWLLPKGESYESETNGVFHFDVTMRVPFAGLIASYKGWLKPNPA